jgi:IS5 family transposase
VYALSDEDVVERWCENPSWQHFSGERYFRHDLPCDPSSLVRWRQRIGEEGCEWLVAHSIEAATRAGVIKRRSLDARAPGRRRAGHRQHSAPSLRAR